MHDLARRFGAGAVASAAFARSRPGSVKAPSPRLPRRSIASRRLSMVRRPLRGPGGGGANIIAEREPRRNEKFPARKTVRDFNIARRPRGATIDRETRWARGG